MIAKTEKSRDELLKESRLFYQKLNREMKAIERTSEPLLRDAYERFKDFKRNVRYNDFSKYSDERVKDIYRDLDYILSLKSATKEGAVESVKTYGKTRDFLTSLSKQKQEEFWDIYSRAYKNLMPSMIDRYKYDVFNILSSEMLLGQNPEDIFDKIKEAFDEAYEEGVDEGERGNLFADKLELLYSESFDNLFDKYI